MSRRSTEDIVLLGRLGLARRMLGSIARCLRDSIYLRFVSVCWNWNRATRPRLSAEPFQVPVSPRLIAMSGILKDVGKARREILSELFLTSIELGI